MPHDAYPNALDTLTPEEILRLLDRRPDGATAATAAMRRSQAAPVGIVPGTPASLAPFSSNEPRARRLRGPGATM